AFGRGSMSALSHPDAVWPPASVRRYPFSKLSVQRSRRPGDSLAAQPVAAACSQVPLEGIGQLLEGLPSPGTRQANSELTHRHRYAQERLRLVDQEELPSRLICRLVVHDCERDGSDVRVRDVFSEHGHALAKDVRPAE